MYGRKNSPQISIDGVSPTPEEAPVLQTLVDHWYGKVAEVRPDPNSGEAESATPVTFNDITVRRLTAYYRALGSQVILHYMDKAVERRGDSVQIGYVMTSLANHVARPRQYTSTDLLAFIQRESGRKGGASTSDAKAEAARENGAKGGRPRKVEPAPPAPAHVEPAPPAPAVEPTPPAPEAPAETRTEKFMRLVALYKRQPDVVTALRDQRRWIAARDLHTWLDAKLAEAMRTVPAPGMLDDEEVKVADDDEDEDLSRFDD